VEQHAAGVCCNLLQLLRTTTVLFLVFWVATISSTVAAAIILQPNSLQVLYYH
jgi:hypothetical protein